MATQRAENFETTPPVPPSYAASPDPAPHVLTSQRLSVYARYGLAALIVAALVGVRFLLDPLVGDLYPYFTAFAAVTLCGWMLGWRPALVALVLGGLIHLLLFIEPRGTLSLGDTADVIGLLLYVATGLLICMLAAARGRAEVRQHARYQEARIGRETLRSLMEHIPAGVVIADAPGPGEGVARIRMISKAAAEIAGRPSEALTDCPVGDHVRYWKILDSEGNVPGADQMPLYRAIFFGQFTANQSYVIEKPDGTRVPVLASAGPICDGAAAAGSPCVNGHGPGRITGAIVVFRDMTRELDARHAQDLHNARFRVLFDEAPTPKWLMCAASLHFHEVNKAATTLFGYTREEFLGTQGRPGMKLCDLRAPGDGPCALEKDGERFSGTVQTRGRAKDGRILDVELTVHAMEGVEPGTVLVEVIDVTQRTRALAQLNEKAAELERSNADLEEFAHAAAHDLKEPLRGINLYASFLRDDFGAKLPEEGVRMTHTISRLATRSAALIDSLLEFSRAGRTRLRLENTDLNSVVRDVLEGTSTLIGEQCVQVRALPLPVVRCDRAQAGSVFTNLVTNAIKYNQSDPKVIEIGAVTAQDAGAAAEGLAIPHDFPVLYVKDNGIGIKPEHQQRIFKMFKRLHGPEEFGGGTGAGLPLAQKLVHRHGGQMWVRSRPGEGSTFYFTLGPEAR